MKTVYKVGNFEVVEDYNNNEIIICIGLLQTILKPNKTYYFNMIWTNSKFEFVSGIIKDMYHKNYHCKNDLNVISIKKIVLPTIK